MRKNARKYFADLVRAKGFTREDMEKYREILHLADKARAERDKGCTGSGDPCQSGDCGYDEEGGCNSDECCDKLCDSCMLTWSR